MSTKTLVIGQTYKLHEVPVGSRIKTKNQYRATDEELEYFEGVVTFGVSGPGEGVMVQWDHLATSREIKGPRETNPYREVELLALPETPADVVLQVLADQPLFPDVLLAFNEDDELDGLRETLNKALNDYIKNRW